jgi:molybdate/tungstate transport system ATP-binding protein
MAPDNLTLKIAGVSKTLGTFRLKPTSFEVEANEYFVLLGPTGAGKTVLLELIMGFHRPDEGKILLDNREITNLPTEKRGIGYAPQNCPLFPHLNVFENVEFGLKMQRTTTASRKKIVERMLELMDLQTISERMPPTLSGGERQKTILARLLVTKPKVVLLDEPLTSIDTKTNRILRQELKRINSELKVAFVHVTHDQIEAFSLADKIAVIQNGEILQLGQPATVLSNPANEFVARFLGYENVFRATLLKQDENTSEVAIDKTAIKLLGRLDRDRVTVAVRPENIVVTLKGNAFSENWNVLEGTITGYMDLGPIVEVNVDAGLALKALMDKRSFLESNLAIGEQVHAGFRIDSVKTVNTG